MPQLSPALVIILVIGIVVIVNGVMIVAARRGTAIREIEMWRRAARTVRNPWAEQEQKMSELHERVADLKHEPAEDE